MPTVAVNLDMTQYVKVNTAFKPIVLQSLRDSVRIVLSDAKPVVDNTVFHMLEGKDAPLQFHSPDTNIWALAMTDRSSLIASEMNIYIDQYSGAVGVIDQEHLKIHKGEGYTVSKRFTIANVGGVHEFLVVVPALVFPHFRSITVTSDGGPNDIDFYEGTTYSATGAAITPLNNNRNSANTAELLIYDSPTITGDGTLLEPVLIPGTKQSGSLGSEASNEWILKQDETYMIRLTNNTTGAGTSNFTINMFFYE